MKGIMLIESLFNKTIKGTKTKTRRRIEVNPHTHVIRKIEDYVWGVYEKESDTLIDKIKPNYKADTVVFLKEPYDQIGNEFYKYKFDVATEAEANSYKWKNKMFMPASAARYYIRIKDVKIEMLQDITEEEARAEGIESDIPTMEFFKLWNSINKKAPFTVADNPYVFVYEYEILFLIKKDNTRNNYLFTDKAGERLTWSDNIKFLSDLPF